MQTFLPFPDFQKSAEALDRARLGKQRSEALQLVRGQWRHHPASRMWRGHEYQLAEYGKVVCLVWRARGYQDTCLEKFEAEQAKHQDTGLPKWFGDPAFHLAHQSKLRGKLPEHYCPLFPNTPDDLPYVWPGDAHVEEGT